MQIFDQMTAQLSNLTTEAKALPAQLDAISACKAAGVQVPETGKFADMAHLDMALSAAFPPTDPRTDALNWPKRVALKQAILAAKLVDQVDQPNPKATEGAMKEAVRLMHVHNIKPRADGTMFVIADIDAMAKERNLSPTESITLKRAFEQAGLLDTAGTTVAKPPMVKPAAGVVESICASLDIDTPKPSEKLSVATLNSAMDRKGLHPERRIQIKATLGAAGVF